MQIQIISHSESETEQLGRNFGERLPAANPGWVIGLSGTLGAGKTAFMRAVAQGCGIEPSQGGQPNVRSGDPLLRSAHDTPYGRLSNRVLIGTRRTGTGRTN